ncbi:MAG TPA: hypothetical protein VGG34_10510 [Opitutaceae bacterium]|jgi:hypothetical protein
MDLTEAALLNLHYPGRLYVKDFDEITPYLRKYTRNLKATYTSRNLLEKLVFPTPGEDFKDHTAGSMAILSPEPNLRGASIVIGRFLSVSHPDRSGDRSLSLADTGDSKLLVGSVHWECLCTSFGAPKIPDAGHTQESLVIAYVKRENAEMRVADIAWMTSNRNGILTLSDYEHRTAEALILLGYKFFKPQNLHFRFGTEAMLVDFIVHSATGPFVLEEDPHNSFFELRKLHRNSRFEKENVSFLSHDGARYPDLRYSLPSGVGPWSPVEE